MNRRGKNNSDKVFLGLPWTIVIFLALAVIAGIFLYGYYLYPSFTRDYGSELPFSRAMFGEAIEQPIPFSHRLHVTDKKIDCLYCHPYATRSLNAGLPTVQKCLGCHDHIIPHHDQIEKLRSYKEKSEQLPWVKVYYAPDHVWFPHYRHIQKGLRCQQCHSNVQNVDRLRQVTFYMGFCIECHRAKNAPLECVGCHQ